MNGFASDGFKRCTTVYIAGYSLHFNTCLVVLPLCVVFNVHFMATRIAYHLTTPPLARLHCLVLCQSPSLKASYTSAEILSLVRPVSVPHNSYTE
jgi:hypothetical protein